MLKVVGLLVIILCGLCSLNYVLMLTSWKALEGNGVLMVSSVSSSFVGVGGT
jgi:hypothetical protein